MRKISIILVLMAGICFYAFGQEITNFPDSTSKQDSSSISGKYWTEMGMLNQVPFLTGFYDGISLGAGLALNGVNDKSVCSSVAASAYGRIQILDSIQLMYIQDEISAIYKDPENKCLKIEHVFWIAANRLAKSDPAYINKLFEVYRKEDCLSKVQK
jgi:hypothetical protein